MGLAEELEDLRKQGVTTKNANDLRDAEGLSTPEDSENAIKAELERTRLTNYGKEASNYLKASPLKKKQPPTKPFDDSIDENDDQEVAKEADQNPKDITNLIEITNDFSFVGDSEKNTQDDEENSRINPIDCLFGTGQGFCPIDSMESARSSVRGALDEHVFPRVDGATASLRTALDEHINPSVEQVRKQSMETVEGFHKRSLETIDRAKQQSIRTFDSASAETQRLLGEVQSTSQKGLEALRQQSQFLLDRSKQSMDGVSAQTVALVDETIVPKCQILIKGIKGLWTALMVTYAPYYTGTARGWKDIDVLSSAWYFVLVEATLRAVGRVVFCDNPVTGIFILIGVTLASPLAALCALFGALTANVMAIYLDLDPGKLQNGHYARNAVLVGTCLVDSFDFDFPDDGNLESGIAILIFWSVALAPCTLFLETVWLQQVPDSVPSLLLPFNVVLLATLFAANVWNFAMKTQIVFSSPPIGDEDASFWIHQSVLNGIARIFNVNGSAWTGLCMLVGILFCSRIVAASLVVGSFVSTVFLGYCVFEENHWYLDSGYAGANPALCAAGIFFYLVPSWRLTGLALFGIVATLIVQGAVDVVLRILGTPVLTSLGFCITFLSLLSIGFPSIFANRKDYFIRMVPYSQLSTPEGYLKGIECDVETLDILESTETGAASTEKDSATKIEEDLAVPTNEETPLLS